MLTISLTDLIAYTDWERHQWREWLSGRGDRVLEIAAGPHGDGRFQKLGDLLRHIFSAEKRYVDRLSARPVTDTSSLPSDNLDALFQFAERSRKDLNDLLATFPATAWDTPQELKLMNSSLTVTSRKIIVHVLLHEIRHWAQVATLLRLNGLAPEFHDFLFSPVLGGDFRRGLG
jgi:uncharacterized damage-inducible protein DinB